MTDSVDRYYRVLVNLQDNQRRFNSEECTVFRMRKGQVWFLDAASLHSAINTSTFSRRMLCLDFKISDEFSPEQIFADDSLYDTTIKPTIMDRKPVSDRLAPDPGGGRVADRLLAQPHLRENGYE
nr:aspartyl/asparaginyl beta-hydroxylase domain-containing protein [Nocardia sp. CNY236]